MEPIACVLVEVAIGLVFSGGGEDLADFLAAFSIAVALIALAYMGFRYWHSREGKDGIS